MSKTVFCYVCKKPVEVQDDRAIAKLCSEHDNDSNRQAMVNTPIKQLLSLQNDGLKLYVEGSLKTVEDGTKENFQTIMNMIKALQDQIANLPKETEQSTNTESLGVKTVNEYGEII